MTEGFATDPDDQAVKAGIRPEDVQISPQEEGSLIGEVELIEPVGLGTIVHIRAVHYVLKAFVLERVASTVGTSISYKLPASKLHIFNPRTGQRLPE